MITAGLLFLLGCTQAAAATNQIAADQCCDYVGDIDNSGAITVSDLTYLIAYLFRAGDPIPCPEEADVNSDATADITDLTALVAFMFRGGPPPLPCLPSIAIIGLEPGDDLVHGTAHVLDTSQYRVVLWAKTDRWYVQPYTAAPFTYIQGNGLWWNYTNPWDRMLSLLVDSSYIPGSIREYHPASDAGVAAWDEYPEKAPDRFIEWSGYSWRVKKGNLTGPGPNYFSDDTLSVRVDENDQLHLKIDYRDDKWYCAEVVLDRSLGYGRYTFKVDSRIDSLDFNTIFAGFVYETTNREFDFEFSSRLANPYNAQYVVQPWYADGNIEFYDVPATSQTAHSFEWRADRIVFESWTGHADMPTSATLIHTWTYTGADIPPPGEERVRFNLYLFGGEDPVQGVGDEVVVVSFAYTD